MDFVDLRGASGTAYRFRRWPANAAHPPLAGNVVVVGDQGRTLLAVSVLEDLSRAPTILGDRAAGLEIFTRLNLTRRIREAEHADLTSQHPDALTNLNAVGALIRTA